MSKALMIQGTGSHVGKSLLVAALCRIFRRKGLRVAPFKAQNMALNAHVTTDGKEMARAQATQAEAAGIPPGVEMNPVLLKATSHTSAQVILMGKAVGNMGVMEYRAFKARAWEVICEAYRKLSSQFDLIVIEGAGSPAEINLKSDEIVNMRVAGMTDARVLLAGDIDRGGIFAAFVGTMELLTPEERARVAGFIINKFRGDAGLLKGGIDFLEARLGKKVFGIVPYLEGLDLPEEDGVA
ncbi:MAG TPA: cobyric acid synthase, partial [Nitrospiria bacterium]|nr:cobyric acid synthase [Nitrospiria bacterium]